MERADTRFFTLDSRYSLISLCQSSLRGEKVLQFFWMRSSPLSARALWKPNCDSCIGHHVMNSFCVSRVITPGREKPLGPAGAPMALLQQCHDHNIVHKAFQYPGIRFHGSGGFHLQPQRQSVPDFKFMSNLLSASAHASRPGWVLSACLTVYWASCLDSRSQSIFCHRRCHFGHPTRLAKTECLV